MLATTTPLFVALAAIVGVVGGGLLVWLLRRPNEPTLDQEQRQAEAEKRAARKAVDEVIARLR